MSLEATEMLSAVSCALTSPRLLAVTTTSSIMRSLLEQQTFERRNDDEAS